MRDYTNSLHCVSSYKKKPLLNIVKLNTKGSWGYLVWGAELLLTQRDLMPREQKCEYGDIQNSGFASSPFIPGINVLLFDV